MENQDIDSNVSSQQDMSVNATIHSGKTNYWKLSTIVLGFLLLLSLSGYLLTLQNANSPAPKARQIPSPTPDTISSPPVNTNQRTFVGTIKLGSQFEAGRNLCPTGLFLVADEGSYLHNQTQFLLLKLPNITDVVNAQPTMLNDEKYINQRVQITGIYPTSENRCEAMTCQCADYILLNAFEKSIVVLDAVDSTQSSSLFEGTLDCLSHRNTSQGQTLECAIGLKDQSGVYYGLLINDSEFGQLAPGDKVRISGTKVINKMPDPVYKTAGTIEVASITKVK